MYYIFFVGLGVVSGLIQYFIERGWLKKTLVIISLSSFIGLGIIGYFDSVNYERLQTQTNKLQTQLVATEATSSALQNQLNAAEASSSLLEAQTEKLQGQIFSPSPKTQIIILSTTTEDNDLYSTELSFGIGVVAGANEPTLTSISPPPEVTCGPLSGPSTAALTAFGPLTGLIQRDWTTNCTSTGPIPENASFGMSYQ